MKDLTNDRSENYINLFFLNSRIYMHKSLKEIHPLECFKNHSNRWNWQIKIEVKVKITCIYFFFVEISINKSLQEIHPLKSFKNHYDGWNWPIISKWKWKWKLHIFVFFFVEISIHKSLKEIHPLKWFFFKSLHWVEYVCLDVIIRQYMIIKKRHDLKYCYTNIYI